MAGGWLGGVVVFDVFDFRDGCFFDGFDHVEDIEVLPVLIGGFEDVGGQGAGVQTRVAGGGWCNVIANLEIVLHLVAWRCILVGRWGFGSC